MNPSVLRYIMLIVILDRDKHVALSVRHVLLEMHVLPAFTGLYELT